MSSVLRRIVGVADIRLRRVRLPARRVAGDGRVARSTAPQGAGGVDPARASRGNRRRVALCIGIDRYRDRPLKGCVNDARLWSRTLSELGFEVRLLLDEQATQRGITDAVRTLLDGAGPGDVLALRYSGTGRSCPTTTATNRMASTKPWCPSTTTRAGSSCATTSWPMRCAGCPPEPRSRLHGLLSLRHEQPVRTRDACDRDNERSRALPATHAGTPADGPQRAACARGGARRRRLGPGRRAPRGVPG